ncbi:hypothetical protein GIB67_014563, partial [Kingdonia uniflora]
SENLRASKKEYSKTEDDLKSLQSVGQIIEVDPVVYNMLHEDPGNISYLAVGGLSDQIRELRKSIELLLMNPELFLRVEIKPPKVVSSANIDKYIGVSARLIREIFGYACDHQLKMIMATNRPDVLDPALLCPGRLDRKIEIPLPNEQSRMGILKIYAAGIAKHGEIDYEAVVKLAEGFNGADLQNVCTEAGMFAIRAERDYVIHEDFMEVMWVCTCLCEHIMGILGSIDSITSLCTA